MGEVPLVLGIDAGGSKTLLALATPDGQVIGQCRGAGTNPFDQPDWQNVMTGLLDDLAPWLPASQAAAAGLAGYGELADMTAAQDDTLAGLLRCRHTLHNDVQVAFDGAFQDRPGVLILAGTGSMAWAQSAAAHAPVRVGGWGHTIGDEGSAFWIGQRAVALIAHALDGRSDATGFAFAMLQRMGLQANPSQAGLLHWYHSRLHHRSEVAGLARHVDMLATSGDAVAIGLIYEAADALCLHVQAARRAIGMDDAAWSHAGGLFQSSVLRQAMIRRLGPPVPPALPPIGGALWRAAHLAGWRVDTGWITRLAASLADPDNQISNTET